ncbi:MAG: ParA family protein, partial [Chitinivibrionales bacterium]|nr:ParA family protein [Chitinivibrionales bacterium]
MSANPAKTFIFADTENGGIIHVANIKGGVGKSTVATNLAASLAKKGPTLLIDLDVQGSATVALGKNLAHTARSSWDLFSQRFSSQPQFNPRLQSRLLFTIANAARACEARLFGWIVGKGEITNLVEKVDSCLDIIPGGSPLFKTTHFYHIQNFRYNLELCRNYYKYIVLDTPSVWNRLTRMLFSYCQINLIPVTLNALSTKSLKDYLIEVRRLAEKNSAIRIRIVKNEVFGREDSKVKGKIRTMSENRKFLDSLCESVVRRNEQGVAIVPQSILFDLEIPESAIVRDAQDEGKSVHLFHQYSAVTKAFDELA